VQASGGVVATKGTTNKDRILSYPVNVGKSVSGLIGKNKKLIFVFDALISFLPI